jgi:phosphatidylinositol alpha-mannosyltransferase
MRTPWSLFILAGAGLLLAAAAVTRRRPSPVPARRAASPRSAGWGARRRLPSPEAATGRRAERLVPPPSAGSEPEPGARAAGARRPLRIGLVSAYDYAYPGGVAEHMRGLAAALRRLGHEVTVLAPTNASGSARQLPGYVPMGRTVPVRGNGSIAHVGLSPFVGRRARAVVEAMAFDVIHYHEPLLPALPLLVLRVHRGINVGTFHASAERSAAYRWARPFLGPYFRRLHACIAVSAPARELVERYFPGEYRIVPNGVDTQRFGPGTQPYAPFRRPGQLTVLFVGRLDRRKGLESLLAAFAMLRQRRDDVRLVIVGDGPLRPACERFVARHGVPEVTFAGFVDAAILPGCYAAADVFCAPATGNESFGIVLLEAMASGVPVLASAIPGFRGIISHGRQGLLPPPGEPGAWAAALGELLDDPTRRRGMSLAGVVAARRYDWSRVAAEVLDVYEEAGARWRTAPRRGSGAALGSIAGS